MFKKTKRKEVNSGFTPSLPRQVPIQGGALEKNSVPPSNAWNYTSRSSSISYDDTHRTSSKSFLSFKTMKILPLSLSLFPFSCPFLFLLSLGTENHNNEKILNISPNLL